MEADIYFQLAKLQRLNNRVPKSSHVIVMKDGEWNVALVLGEIANKGCRLQMECTRECIYNPLDVKDYGYDNASPRRWVLLRIKM